MASPNHHGVTFTRKPGADGDALRLRAPSLTVDWSADGQLSLSLPGDDGTRITGGWLIEPMKAAARRLNLTAPARFAPTGAAPDPAPFQDALGSGVNCHHRLPPQNLANFNAPPRSYTFPSHGSAAGRSR